MMKKKLLTLALCLSASLLGECPRFGATLDYLYWKPFNLPIDSAFIASVEGTERNTFTLVAPTYNSGVRGEAWAALPCCPVAFVGRYYWVDCRQSQTFRGEGVLVEVENRVQTYYQAGDLLVAHRFCPHRCLTIEALAGAKVLYFANDGRSDQQRGNVPVRAASHRRFAGGGGAVGALLTLSPLRHLDLFAEGQYGLLIGSRRTTAYRILTSFSTASQPISIGTWTREVDLRLGGRLHGQSGSMQLGLELGWEARSYLENPSTFESGTRDSGTSMGGLFLGLSATF